MSFSSQAEDGIRDYKVTGVQTCALPISLSERTRAIMIAHTLGNPFNIAAVTAFAKENNLWLIEDCCDAVGATYGKIGRASCRGRVDSAGVVGGVGVGGRRRCRSSGAGGA